MRMPESVPGLPSTSPFAVCTRSPIGLAAMIVCPIQINRVAAETAILARFKIFLQVRELQKLRTE